MCFTRFVLFLFLTCCQISCFLCICLYYLIFLFLIFFVFVCFVFVCLFSLDIFACHLMSLSLTPIFLVIPYSFFPFGPALYSHVPFECSFRCILLVFKVNEVSLFGSLYFRFSLCGADQNFVCVCVWCCYEIPLTHPLMSIIFF